MQDDERVVLVPCERRGVRRSGIILFSANTCTGYCTGSSVPHCQVRTDSWCLKCKWMASFAMH